MSLYLVSYDLLNHATLGQYEKLIAELERLGARRVQKSEWVWKSSNSPVEIRDHLKQFIHTSDRILITAVSDWASWNSLFKIGDL
jgi:CRISPR/Cas system-associated endoribonuclease Cas2